MTAVPARRKAREAALRILYSMEFDRDQQPEGMRPIEQLTGDARALADDLVRGVGQHRELLDRHLGAQMSSWDIGGIGKVEVSILRMALYEILFREDIPEKVSINEAVELAKTYCGPKAGSFVNGVLDGVRKRIAAAEAAGGEAT